MITSQGADLSDVEKLTLWTILSVWEEKRPAGCPQSVYLPPKPHHQPPTAHIFNSSDIEDVLHDQGKMSNS